MELCESKAVDGRLRRRISRFYAVAAFLVGSAAVSAAQQPPALTLTVVDQSGAAVAGAVVQQPQDQLTGRTDANGQLTIYCHIPCSVRIDARGFEERSLRVNASETVSLNPAGTVEQVTVAAYRAPLGSLESPVTTRVLSQVALRTTAAPTMDEQVRQLPGIELFRRSSSLVANPTSQGISLRGLGSTSASRTLVTEDDVPLNDPVGGWIHWEEQPQLALDRIEVLRGGGSDLYGSSAIGGVLSLVPVRPATTLGEVRSSYGGLGTYDLSALLETKFGAWGLLGSGGAIGTDGFIQIAPGQRGPIDTASSMHAQDGVIDAEHNRGPLRLFVRGSGFNEARANGTPFQINSTRLWRYATGADAQSRNNGSGSLRLYGSTERYRQTFSAISNTPTPSDPICSHRCGETPTRFSQTPDNELGAAAHWSQPIGTDLLVVGGADTHDVRVWDREQTLGATPTLTSLDDRQRDSGMYAEGMWTHVTWTATASGRLDWFRNFDARQAVWNGTTWVPAAVQPPTTDEFLMNPRMGLSRKFGQHWAISASGFRAFRAPTPSELYRSTQVGSKLTLPNPSLLSERATGWESGVASQWHWGTIRTSYFDTQVNRPIGAVTINPASPLLLKRQNLGQIESRGVGIDFQLAPQSWLGIDGGYQYAHAVVSRGTEDLGKWIPEVARNMASLNLRAFRPRLGTLALQSRLSGRQYDDDANLFLLHGYFRLDAYGSHNFGPLELFAAGENLFDRAIEVSKTPNTTLATPRVIRAGLQFQLSKAK